MASLQTLRMISFYEASQKYRPFPYKWPYQSRSRRHREP
jgi:hypothetical protein